MKIQQLSISQIKGKKKRKLSSSIRENNLIKILLIIDFNFISLLGLGYQSKYSIKFKVTWHILIPMAFFLSTKNRLRRMT